MEASRRAQVEDLTTFSCAQYDAVEPRISREEWEKMLEHPCNASALSDGVPFHLTRPAPTWSPPRATGRIKS